SDVCSSDLAIVETGTRAATAASIASLIDRPEVLSPSDSSTIADGGGSVTACWSNERSASSELNTASPIAVPGRVVRLWIAVITAAWSVVGGATTAAERANDT